MSRRLWFARDAWLTSDPLVQQLGADHGAAGPLALEELMALAKLAERDGTVSTSYAALAMRTFTSATKVKAIVLQAGELGLIDLEANGRAFTASFPNWSKWQTRDPTAAERQARARARKANGGTNE